jgi:hypothetical protein
VTTCALHQDVAVDPQPGTTQPQWNPLCHRIKLRGCVAPSAASTCRRADPGRTNR